MDDLLKELKEIRTDGFPGQSSPAGCSHSGQPNAQGSLQMPSQVVPHSSSRN